MSLFDSSWFYWAVGVAVGLPVGLIALTEWHHALARRQSDLARPVALLRHYLFPLAALLVLLVEAAQIPFQDTSVRVLATVFGFVVLVLLLSGFNATVFQGAPEGSWRKRVPAIFLDVARFLLIGIGLAVIFSYVWGVRFGGLFAALGVTSVVIGLMLQNSVGQIVSGLFMLLEQPFRIGDWLETDAAAGEVVEVNWRAVHLQTLHGLQITPNSVLAATSFHNHSRRTGTYNVLITTRFSIVDPPDQVCAVLSRTAGALPQLEPGSVVTSVALGGAQYRTTMYRTTIVLKSRADEYPTQWMFLRWIWYAARRAGLHLDSAHDDFSTTTRVEKAMRTVVAPALRLDPTDQQSLVPHARMVRYGTDEVVEFAGEVPTVMTFLIEGRVQLMAMAEGGSPVATTTLGGGSFLGLTALTRQPNLAGAYALQEVTALEIDREHLEELVMRKPLLLQDLGRILDERRSAARQAVARTAGLTPSHRSRPDTLG